MQSSEALKSQWAEKEATECVPAAKPRPEGCSMQEWVDSDELCNMLHATCTCCFF